MSSIKSPMKHLSLPFRWMAVTLPLLVVALGVLACRPDWHAALHASLTSGTHQDGKNSQPDGKDEAACAIHMYAQGQMHFVALPLPDLAPSSVISQIAVIPLQVLVPTSPSTGPPGRAPPVAS